MPLIATANAICNGIAGVNGPAQKAHISPNGVQNQGLITIANIAVTMQGDQNINSAMMKYTIISLLITFFLNHCQNFFNLSFIHIYKHRQAILS